MKRWRKVLLLTVVLILCFHTAVFATTENIPTAIQKWDTKIKGEVLQVVESKINCAALTLYIIQHQNSGYYMLNLFILDKNTGAVKLKIENRIDAGDELNLTQSYITNSDLVLGGHRCILFIGRPTLNLKIMRIRTSFKYYIYCVDIDQAEIKWKINVEHGGYFLGKYNNLVSFFSYKYGITANKGSIYGIDISQGFVKYRIEGVKSLVDIGKSNTAICLKQEKFGLIKSHFSLVSVFLPKGEILWKSNTFDVKEFYLRLSDDIVYLLHRPQKKDYYLAAFDLKTGKNYYNNLIGTFKIKEVHLLKDNNLLLAQLKKGLIGINIKNGELKWQSPFDKKITKFYFNKNNIVALSGGGMFSKKFITVINPDTGQKKWSMQIPSKSKGHDISDKKVYILFKRKIEAFDLNTGEKAWDFFINDSKVSVYNFKATELENDTVVLQPNNKQLYLVDDKTGTPKTFLKEKGQIVSYKFLDNNKKIAILLYTSGKYKFMYLKTQNFEKIWEHEFKIGVFQFVRFLTHTGEKDKNNYLFISIEGMTKTNILVLNLTTKKYLTNFMLKGDLNQAFIVDNEDGSFTLYCNYTKFSSSMKNIVFHNVLGGETTSLAKFTF